MICEVIIDMKNENALYTVSMLSAMLENSSGDYLDLLKPFVLHSLPPVGSTIDIDAVTIRMQEFGFKDFPHKVTEKILGRLCKASEDGNTYVLSTTVNKKRKYRVQTAYKADDFDASSHEMRRKIDGILKEMQKYFEEHFYYKTLPLEDVHQKLIRFFESNGLTVIQSVGELKLVPREHGSDAFEVARFVLNEHERKSIIYDDLCEVTKGFLTYKAIYYFADEHKNSMESKFRDVTFYLDCSLVLDALGYDTAEDEKAIKELIRLVRRNGGDVRVFRHTTEEAAKLIEAFANQLHHKNKFRLDSLAQKNLSREVLLMIAGQIPETLREKAQIETVDMPSFEDANNYINLLGEKEIIEWLKRNRTKHTETTYSDDERFGFDARSLNAISMLRRGTHPNFIEHAKAMLVTQDTWLNRCLRELYGDRTKTEVAFAISDTELVSLLWLRDYKEVSNLPSDILIANAHAACRVSQEVMDRAIQIANAMVEAGTLNVDAALLVTAHPNFKGFLAEQVRNNTEMLSENQIRDTINAYISTCAHEQIQNVREEEREHAQRELNNQKDSHTMITAEYQELLQKSEAEAARLRAQIENDKKDAIAKKVERADKYARRISNALYALACVLLIAATVTVAVIFSIQCYREIIQGDMWIPYVVVEALGVVGVLALFAGKKSPGRICACRQRDKIYSWFYSYFLKRE